LSRSRRNSLKKYIKSFYSSLEEPMKDQSYYQERLATRESIKANKNG